MKRWLLLILSILVLTATTAMAGTVGETTVDLDGRNILSQETNVGNFVADAMRNATGADIAFLEGKALQKSVLPRGEVSEQALREALVSSNNAQVTVKLTPALLQKMLDRALSRVPEVNNAFLQLSGMKVSYDSTKPAASRILSITIADKELSAYPADHKFTVAMTRELANGAYGYFFMNTDEVTTSMVTKEQTLLDAIKSEFARQQQKISPAIDGRLTDKGAKKP